MKKLLLSGLLLLSMGSLKASANAPISADNYMNKYGASLRLRNSLIAGHGSIADYNSCLKALYLAKADAYYDISMSSYIKSYFYDTPENCIIKNIAKAERDILDSLAIKQNNTWEDWGWATARYSSVIFATYLITLYTARH